MMGKSTVHRELQVLHQTGMLPQTSPGPNKPAIYFLADLRKLAKLGEAEIRRRMGVPQGDSGDEGGGSDPDPEGGDGWPQSGPGSGDTPPNSPTNGHMEATAPGGSGEGTVPQGDSQPDSGPVDENLRKTTIADLWLSQKRGVTVPQARPL